LSEYVARQFDYSLSWDDLEWIQSEWSGPLVVKGIQSAADAGIAARMGVDAVALSNHGGRQLDGAPTPISILRETVEAVGGHSRVILDGGVRRGSDVVKALALGATAVMVGRLYLYGLGAFGEIGVDHALRLLRSDIERVMALIGIDSMKEITPDVVRRVGNQIVAAAEGAGASGEPDD
jgi:L-lactate dehydrogenase (cytochrome)